MAGRRGHGEDGVSFDHRGRCTDPERHRHCPGRWVGQAELPRTPDGKRNRRRVVGKTKTAVLDKLKELHKDLDKGIVPQTGGCPEFRRTSVAAPLIVRPLSRCHHRVRY